MKKRLISMLMAVLMIASLLPASAVFAADDTAKCEHKNTDAVIVMKKDAKNKVPGVTATVCKDCGEVTDVTIEQFKKDGLLIKCDCKTNKIVEAQKASCGQFGLTVSYCVDCGKAFNVKDLAGKDGKETYYKVEAALEHFYDDFQVYQAPTCQKDGWGYVVCKNCGDPKFVKDADEAITFVDASNFSSIKAFEARIRDVYDMYQAVNVGHKDKTQFVAVTETMKAADGTELNPAKAASHVATVNGKAYTFNKTTGKYETDLAANTFNDGYTGDTVCPYCNGEDASAYVKGKVITHKWEVVKDKVGSFPTSTGYGKADIVKCDDCKYTGAGNYIYNVSSWYLDDAVAATCTDNGKTATYCWIDKTGNIQKKSGNVINALGHNFEPVEGKAASGHENGFAYVNYEKCANEGCNEYKGDPDKKVIIKAESASCKFEAFDLVPATCNHEGLTISKCPVCGEYEINADGDYVINNSAKVKNHVASDVLANVKEATCTEEGYTGDVVCKFCGEVMKPGEKTKMVDHTPVAVDAKAPTCTEPGVTKGTICSVCKTVLDAQETVPALGHKESVVNAKDATCTEAGYTGDTVCTVCNETLKKGEDIKALGHNYVNGLCSRCDAKQPGFNPFSDVKAGPYYDAILWAYENGVAAGKADGTFGVNDPCTRAQIVTFLWRAAGEPIAKNAVNPFSDVSAKSPYYNAILWAVENGITAGTTATTFSPNAPCTRAQIVTFLWRYENKPIVSTLAKFDDVSESSVYYNAIMWAVETGITSGVTKTTFAPNDTCTRGQAVTFIYREFASK